MGLFEKKYCDICGEKIKLLGNKKLEDGNMCKECESKLSPFFANRDRKNSTVAEIKEQLAYREKNKQNVASFTAGKCWGRSRCLYIDESKGNFIVTSHMDYKNYNPDVVPLSAITGTSIHVSESSHERKTTDSKGASVSYNPPRFDNYFTVYFVIHVKHPYFDEMSFDISDEFNIPSVGHDRVRASDSFYYHDVMKVADEIKSALLSSASGNAGQPNQKRAVNCPSCGATVIPDEHGCCEYCGTALL